MNTMTADCTVSNLSKSSNVPPDSVTQIKTCVHCTVEMAKATGFFGSNHPVVCLLFHPQMNNVMWQLHMQQLEQLNGGFSAPQQRQPSAGGNSGRGGSRQHNNTPYRQQSSQMHSGGRNQRYAEEPGSGRHQQHGHGRDSYHHQNDRSGNRHYSSRGGSRHHEDRGGSRGYQDNRWRR